MLLAISLIGAPVAWRLVRLDARLAEVVWILPAGLFLAFASLVPAVLGQGHVEEVTQWIPSLGITLSLRLDGLSLLFALLITGIGAFIFQYASSYLRGDADLSRFFARLTLFMSAMLGAVMADDLIVLLVFWEATSLASFLLIGFKPEEAAARRSAQQGLLVTVGGGLCLLAGAIVLGHAGGTLRISELIASAPALAAHPSAPWVIVLVAMGAFAKSAQVPLHAWLPNAMVAPTPVSAFLHSATMVKLGVYLLARLNPVYGELALWTGFLLCAGLATMVTGAVLALRQTDLKRVLAYSTIVSLGTLIMLLALPQPLAGTAMVTFLLVHALYKACLFMVAGIIDHEAGTRDTTLLRGLARRMPLTAGIAVLAGLSMAGLPPFMGFIAKELVYEVNLSDGASWLPVAIALLSNAVMVAVAGVVTYRVFFGPQLATPQVPHDPPFMMWLGPALLAGLGLVFGLLPGLAGNLLAAAARAVTGQPTEAQLSLWHGWTPMLALSGLTLVLGIVFYLSWNRMHRVLVAREAIDNHGPNALYDKGLVALQRVAAWQTTSIQSGSLRRYTGATLAVVGGALGAVLLSSGGLAWPPLAGALSLHGLLPALLLLGTAIVLRARGFTSGIVAAGTVGFGLALTFLFNGAPDLAFTQFSVEAVAIVVLLAIAGRMAGDGTDARTRTQRRTDAAIAIGFGLVATMVLLAVLQTPFDSRLSDYFRETSVPLAHGHNLVNVIIVDFRALDTLGEIGVLALAAMAAAAVLAGSAARRRASAATAGAAPQAHKDPA
ncbi:MAG TPA: hydrogen gas-evolving membrane-bound hydrogenase subunit E [Pseudorhodoferax sp.]|nr:hydrogen gas-evolving membrane-bound hydrogenase subunit E [Pseudorhodoferax sp.]